MKNELWKTRVKKLQNGRDRQYSQHFQKIGKCSKSQEEAITNIGESKNSFLIVIGKMYEIIM